MGTPGDRNPRTQDPTHSKLPMKSDNLGTLGASAHRWLRTQPCQPAQTAPGGSECLRSPSRVRNQYCMWMGWEVKIDCTWLTTCIGEQKPSQAQELTGGPGHSHARRPSQRQVDLLGLGPPRRALHLGAVVGQVCTPCSQPPIEVPGLGRTGGPCAGSGQQACIPTALRAMGDAW